ncbi:MAG: DUF366 family protein [Bdellovibrionota bacterium]
MLGEIKFHILESSAEKPITYTGKELRPHWGLETTGEYGSLLTVFIGPCEVPTAHLVDWEDRLAADHIQAASMLHVVGEFFGTTLEAGVLYQRLFMVWAERLLREEHAQVKRFGDDLFWDDKKLSVSIATASPVSVLIHWGINIDCKGAPVKAAGLNQLGWSDAEVLIFAKKLVTYYIGELEEIQLAQCKVRPV